MIKKIVNYLYFRSQKKMFNDSNENMLKVFDKKKCIFIHIPKTAGISLVKALFGDLDWGHRDVKYYRNVFNKKKFDSYFKFTFVRNPYDRLFSAYSFLKKGGINDQDNNFAKKYLSEYNSFDKFVKYGLTKPEVLSWVHFKPQKDFICNSDGKVVVDFIGRFEQLNRDFNKISEILGYESNLDHLNKTKYKNKKKNKNINEKTKKIIYETYLDDFILFNYPE